MRMWMILGVGALMLVSIILPSGAWGATIDEVRSEMTQAFMPFPMAMKPSLWVPLYGSGQTAVAWTDLCVSGDKLRRQNVEGASGEVGKAPADKQFSVLVYGNSYGDTLILYHRQVSLPECK